MYIIIADPTGQNHIPLTDQLRAEGFSGSIEIDRNAERSDHALVIRIPEEGAKPFVQAPFGPFVPFTGSSHAELARLALQTMKSTEGRGGV